MFLILQEKKNLPRHTELGEEEFEEVSFLTSV